MRNLSTAIRRWFRGLTTESTCTVLQTIMGALVLAFTWWALFQTDIAGEIIALKNRDIREMDRRVERLHEQQAELMQDITEQNRELNMIGKERNETAQRLIDVEARELEAREALKNVERIRDNYRRQASNMAIDEFNAALRGDLSKVVSFLGKCEGMPEYVEWLAEADQLFQLIDQRKAAKSAYEQFEYRSLEQVGDYDKKERMLTEDSRNKMGLLSALSRAERKVLNAFHEWVADCPDFSLRVGNSLRSARGFIKGEEGADEDGYMDDYNYFKAHEHDMPNAIIKQNEEYPKTRTLSQMLAKTEEGRFDRLIEQDRERLEGVVRRFMRDNTHLLDVTLVPVINRNWTMDEFVTKTNACVDAYREVSMKVNTLIEELRASSI